MKKEFTISDNVAENITDEVIFNLKKNNITLFEVVINGIDGYFNGAFKIDFTENKVIVDGDEKIVQIVADSIKELNNTKEQNENS